jgi:hypothetical protein
MRAKKLGPFHLKMLYVKEECSIASGGAAKEGAPTTISKMYFFT